MKNSFILSGAVTSLLLICGYAHTQPEEALQQRLVIRRAQEDNKGTVAVEAYLAGRETLRVKVIAAMERTKPNILDVTLSGPGIGTLTPETIKLLYAELDEDLRYETIRRGAFVSFRKKGKMKEIEGTKTKKLATFKIPADKINPDGDYTLKVKIADAKQARAASGKATRFIFPLEDLPSLVKNSQ